MKPTLLVSMAEYTRSNSRTGGCGGGNSGCRGGGAREAERRLAHTLPFCCHLSLEEKLTQAITDKEAKLTFIQYSWPPCL